MPTKTTTVRLNNEIKKAIHSGDGYHEFKTLMQFYGEMKTAAEKVRKDMDNNVQRFLSIGGDLQYADDGMIIATYSKVTLGIRFDDEDKEIAEIKYVNDTKLKIMSDLADVIYQFKMIPHVDDMMQMIQDMNVDLENDNALRGLVEIRNTFRSDPHLTAFGISGISLKNPDDKEGFER